MYNNEITLSLQNSPEVNYYRDAFTIEIKDAERKWSKNFSESSYVGRAFSEILSLCAIDSVAARLDKFKQMIPSREAEYVSVNELWDDISHMSLSSLNLEAPIVLKDIQLIEFVSRSPQIRSSSRHRYSWYDNDIDFRDTYLCPSFLWSQTMPMTNFQADGIWCGDVRLGEILDGIYILNAVSHRKTGLYEWEVPSINSSELFLPITKEQINQNSSKRDSAKSQKIVSKKLYHRAQNLLLDTNSLDTISAGGIPVLVTAQVYNQLSVMLDEFGAVAIKELHGFLMHIPSQVFPVGDDSFRRKNATWCVFVGNPSQLISLEEPDPVLCSAWTIAIDDNISSDPDDKYLQWMFYVGIDRWQNDFQEAVSIIRSVLKKAKVKPMFEFDAFTNWFGTSTPLNYRTLKHVSQSFRQGATSVKLFENFDR